jgi:hypothetical protein
MSLLEPFLKISAIIFWVGIGWMTISCVAAPETTRFLVDQPDKTVGMEITYREGSFEHSHPAILTSELLDKVLQQIKVEPASLLSRIAGGSSEIQEAFSREQREFLSQNLSQAFSQATPLETVTFYWANPRGNGIWEITSGGLYLKDNELHLVLPNYRQTVPAKTPPQMPRSDPLSPLGEPLHSLTALDPIRQIPHNLATKLWAPQIPHFVFSLNKMANLQPPSNHQQLPPSPPTLNSNASIKQRLKTLEELRREGLLTEKEYQFKRREILEEL